MAVSAASPDAQPNVAAKLAAEVAIANVLDAIVVLGREPDEWEATSLLAAVGAVMGEMYLGALVLAQRATVPDELRAGSWARSLATPSMQQLRASLFNVMRCPAACAAGVLTGAMAGAAFEPLEAQPRCNAAAA